MQDGSNFRNAFPGNWETKLDEILQANTELRCNVCGNLNSTNSLLKRLPSMPEMLENLEFISQFNSADGFNKVINLLKSNANNRDGINHMIRYMKNNSTDFIGASQNLKFEFRYNDDILNTADLMLGNVKYEFKSWLPNTANPWNGFFTGTNSSYNQFIKYLENSASLGEIKYVFNANKVDITTVKNAFKDLFIAKAEDLFKPINQGGLGQAKMNQLFGVDNISDFLDDIDDISSPIYDFIKVE